MQQSENNTNWERAQRFFCIAKITGMVWVEYTVHIDNNEAKWISEREEEIDDDDDDWTIWIV